MEVILSVTVTLTQAELLEALRQGDAAELFENAREQRTLLDIGSVDEDGVTVTRTIVGPPDVIGQIFPGIDQPPAP